LPVSDLSQQLSYTEQENRYNYGFLQRKGTWLSFISVPIFIHINQILRKRKVKEQVIYLKVIDIKITKTTLKYACIKRGILR